MLKNTCTCPDAQRLQSFALGEMPAHELEAVAEHVLHCGACVQTLHTLKVQDTLVEALAAHTPSPDNPRNDVLNALLQRLRGWGNPLTASAGEQTQATRAPEARAAGADNSVEVTGVEAAAPSGQAKRELYDFLAPPQAQDEIGRLGSYRVLKVLGAGGMGVVFQAEDPKLKRSVALKVMKPTLAASGSAGQRFLREAQATAAIKHDHVVTIHQVGEDRGVPFLAMEFLEGEPLDQRLRRQGTLPLTDVLRIGREIAKGLAAAHKRGLIHRDIKPANVWLEAETGRVKIVDFGLARAASEDTHLTQEGAILGTPAYMAPEQASAQHVDARCDLFSLGCLLYRISTGQMPFKGSDTISTLLAIATQEPTPPLALNLELPAAFSDLVMQLLAKNPEARPSSAVAVVEALTAIEADQTQALEPQREGGIANPSLAPALPAPARPRRGLFVALAAGLLLIVGAVLVPQVVIRIFDKEGKEIGKAEIPEGGKGIIEEPGKKPRVIESGSNAADPPNSVNPLDALRWDKIPKDELAAAGGGDPKTAPLGLVTILGDNRLRHWDSILNLSFSTDGKRLAAASKDKVVKVWDLATGQELLNLKGHTRVAFSPDGKRLALGDLGGTIKVRDSVSGKELLTFKGKHKWAIYGVVFSKDGKRIATASEDRTVKAWDADTGKEVLTLKGHVGVVYSVAFSPDGKRLASSSGVPGKLGEVKMWDAASGQEIHSIKGHNTSVLTVAFSPDGTRLVSGDHDGTVKVWDVATGAEFLAFKSGFSTFVSNLVFSPDGKRLAGAYYEVKMWHAETGELLLTLNKGEEGIISSVAFSADGKRLAAGGTARAVKLWEVATGKELLPRTGQPGLVNSVTLTPDSKWLAVRNANNTASVWEVATGKESRALIGCSGDVAVSRDGKLLAAASASMAKVWHAETGKELHTLKGHAGTVLSVAFSPDGKRLAACSGVSTKFGEVKIWDANSGTELNTLKGHAGLIYAVVFSPDGKQLVTGSQDKTVKLWDLATGGEMRTLTGHKGTAYRVAASPDGKWLASGGGSGDYMVKVWEAATGKEVFTLKRHTDDVNAVDFSPDSQTLLSAGLDGRLILWHAATGKKLDEWQLLGPIHRAGFATDGKHIFTSNANGTVYIIRIAPPFDSLRREDIPSHELAAAGGGDPKNAPAELVGVIGDSRLRHWDGVNAVAFSPDDKWITSGSLDGTAKVWDAATGKELLVFKGHSRPVRSVAFSPDSKHVASAGDDKTVQIWDAKSGKVHRVLATHTGPVSAVAYSKDGKYLASAGAEDKTVKVWNSASGQELFNLDKHSAGIFGVAFSRDGKLLASASADKTVKLWDIATGKDILTYKGHKGSLGRVAFVADDKQVASYSAYEMKIWEAATGKDIRTLKDALAGHLVSSHDGKRLAMAHSVIQVWDPGTGKKIQEMKGHSGLIGSLAFNRDGKRLLSGGWDHTVRVWNTATGKEEPLNPTGQSDGLRVAVSPNGRLLATVAGGSARLWGVAAGQEVFKSAERFNWVGLRPDGSLLMAFREPPTLAVRDAGTGQEICTLKGHSGFINSAALSPDGKRLATASADKTVKVWDAATGKDLMTFKGHTAEVKFVCFSPNGEWLASRGTEIKVWETASGKEIHAFQGNLGPVAFSPDRTRIAFAGGNNSVKVCDAVTGTELLRFKRPHLYAYGDLDLVFSPDGKTLALAEANGLVSLWDAASGKRLREWQLPSVVNVAFSPEGRHLLTGNGNGTAYVLRLAVSVAVAAAPLP